VKKVKPKKQIAALPVARTAHGGLCVLVVTSRETRRFVVPKGWPMKGVDDRNVAEIEAREEAGLIGRAHPKPIGSYLAWKRIQTRFELVKVKVFLFNASAQLPTWKEQGQRQMAWLDVEDAALLIDEPGLAALVRDLPGKLPKKWRSKGNAPIPLAAA
jgi:8-oxo-dGTP pyrophosphatase MutT (NUDIX family)